MSETKKTRTKIGNNIKSPLDDDQLAGLVYYMQECRKYAYKIIWSACSTAIKIRELGITEQQLLTYNEEDLCKLISGKDVVTHKDHCHILGDIHRYKDYLNFAVQNSNVA